MRLGDDCYSTERPPTSITDQSESSGKPSDRAVVTIDGEIDSDPFGLGCARLHCLTKAAPVAILVLSRDNNIEGLTDDLSGFMANQHFGVTGPQEDYSLAINYHDCLLGLLEGRHESQATSPERGVPCLPI